MANQKISTYLTECVALASGDRLDVSKQVSPGVYDTQWLDYDTLISEIEADATLDNLYNADGTLTAIRTITTAGHSIIMSGTGNFAIGGNVNDKLSLHTIASTTGSNGIDIRNDVGSIAFFKTWNNADPYAAIGTNTNTPFDIRYSSNSRIRLTAANDVEILLTGNNLGVGVASPAEKLHVNGNGRFDGNINITANAGNPYKLYGQGIIEFAAWAESFTDNGVNTAVNPAIFCARGTGGAPFNGSGSLIIAGRNNNAQNKVFFYTNNGAGSYNETMRLQSDKVGIGGIAPAEKLHVNGKIRLDGSTAGAAGSSSGTYLVLNVGGTDYKLDLLNV